MSERISIECKLCGAKLKLADRSRLGKKIKCPNCSELFVAVDDDEQSDEEIEAVVEDEEAQEGDTDAAKAKAKRGPGAKSAAAKGKKGKSKQPGISLGLIIGGGGGAMVVLLLGLVGVLFAAGAFSTAKLDPNQIQVNPTPGTGVFSSLLKEQPSNAIPVRTPVPDVAQWLPADSEFVLHVRLAEILDAALVKDLLKSFQLEDQLSKATADWGIQPADVESLTLGVAQLEKAQQQMQQAQLAMMMGGPPPLAAFNSPSLAVIKLKKSITYDSLLKLIEQAVKNQPVQKVQHAGKEYLESTDPKTSVKGGAYLASGTVVVLGDSTHLKTAIEKGPAATPVPNFGFMDWTDHLTLAYSPKNPEDLKKNMSAGSQGNPMLGLALAPIVDGASGFSLGLTVKGGLEAEIAVGCVDLAKMDAISKSLTDLTGAGRGQYDQNKNQIPPWAQPLTDFLVSNLKVTGSKRVVVVNTNIPDSAQDKLAQLPTMIMTQLAMGAFLGGPKPPDANRPGDAPPTSPGDAPKEKIPTDDSTE